MIYLAGYLRHKLAGNTKSIADVSLRQVPGKKTVAVMYFDNQSGSRGTIENSVAYNNGALCNSAGACAGGIWAFQSSGITIQNNEAHSNKTNGPYDGGGFDLDKSVRNSVMQYNYSHDNDGVGYMLCRGEPDHYGNVVRYNVSENDGRKNSVGAISVYGNIGAAEIYGNTITVTPSASGTPSAVVASSGAAVSFLNNTFTTTGDLPQVRINYTGANRLFFQGNQYLNNLRLSHLRVPIFQLRRGARQKDRNRFNFSVREE